MSVFKKLIKYIKQIFKREKDMELLFVIPGWYQSNATLNSEKKEVIRVLGGSEKRRDMFLLADGREMHENEILYSYTFMNTAPDENNTTIFNQVDFGDLPTELDLENETPVIENIKNDRETFEPVAQTQNDVYIIENKNIKNDKHTSEPTNQLKSEPKLSEEDIFVNQLLNNLKLPDYNPISLDIPVSFTFNYDLDKLKTIFHTMGTDVKTKHKFIDKILDNNISNIHTIIKQAILEYLTVQIPVENKNVIPNIESIAKVDLTNETFDTEPINNIPEEKTNKYLQNF